MINEAPVNAESLVNTSTRGDHRRYFLQKSFALATLIDC